MLSLPEGEREEFIETHDVSDMSTRELDAAIKERNEAQAKVQQLEKELAAAGKAAADAGAAAEKAQKKIEKLAKESSQAAEGKAKAEAALQNLKDNPAIPQEVMDRIRNEVRETVIASAQAEVQSQLEAAQNNLAAATAARQDAEKALRMSDPDVAAFNVLLVQLQESYNKLNGYRLKIQSRSPEMYDTCTVAQKKLLDLFGKAVQ